MVAKTGDLRAVVAAGAAILAAVIAAILASVPAVGRGAAFGTGRILAARWRRGFELDVLVDTAAWISAQLGREPASRVARAVLAKRVKAACA